jgi:23S rRNA (adenine2503-C2)-methyltransferase
MTTRYDASRADVESVLDGEPRYRVDQLWDALYRQGLEPAEMTNLPKSLRAQVEAGMPRALKAVTQRTSDGGDTVKWLWQLGDGHRVETVLMHYEDRSTVCVSTQAGCAMACGFCATGQAGLDRNLSTGEIVEQVVYAQRAARVATPPRRVSNIVFMGMGEPLANYPRVWPAVERIHDDLGISARHITVSTVGIIPGIKRLATEHLPVNLAVSLHAANDTLRDALVPINRRYPLRDLIDACQEYIDAKGRRLSIEWALIDGVNDRGSDATELAGIARELRAHINLIPLNPTPGYPTRGTPPARVQAFRDLLRELGANATVRQNRGTDIDAACGQLRASLENDVALAPVTLRDRRARPDH